jgi:hypothetical protein
MVDGLSRFPVPKNHRFTLIGNSYGPYLLRLDLSGLKAVNYSLHLKMPDL